MGGDGCFVDVSMTDAVLANNIMPLVAVNHSGQVAEPGQDLLSGGAPCYSLYATSDGRHMAVGALELKFWQHACRVLQRPDLQDAHWMCGMVPNSAPSEAVRHELQQIFLQHDLAHWGALFSGEDCCVSPVLRLDEALQHPLFAARKMVARANHETEGEYWQLGPGLQFMA